MTWTQHYFHKIYPKPMGKKVSRITLCQVSSYLGDLLVLTRCDVISSAAASPLPLGILSCCRKTLDVYDTFTSFLSSFICEWWLWFRHSNIHSKMDCTNIATILLAPCSPLVVLFPVVFCCLSCHLAILLVFDCSPFHWSPFVSLVFSPLPPCPEFAETV